MNPLATFLAYVGIAEAALGHETISLACFAGALIAQAAPAFLARRQ